MKHRMIGAALVALMTCSFAMAADQITLDDLAAQIRQMQQTIDAQNKRITGLEGQLELTKTLTAPPAPSTDQVRAIVRQEIENQPAPACPSGLTV